MLSHSRDCDDQFVAVYVAAAAEGVDVGEVPPTSIGHAALYRKISNASRNAFSAWGNQWAMLTSSAGDEPGRPSQRLSAVYPSSLPSRWRSRMASMMLRSGL
jgi:hypothetical protein